MLEGGLRRLLEVRGRCRHAELVAVSIEHPQHEDVAAAEDVSRNLVSRLAQHRADRHGHVDNGHVAPLAAIRLSIGALLPFQIGHLLGELADDAAVAIDRGGEQGVTGGAQLGALDVLSRGRRERRCRAHDPLEPGVDLVRPVDLPLLRQRRLDEIAAIETGVFAQVLLRDLVTDRAGDAVPGDLLLVRREALFEIPENLAGTAVCHGLRPEHGHVTDRAGVLDRGLQLRMIRDLPAHRRLPIRILCGKGHQGRAPGMADRQRVACGVDHVAVAADALVGGDERGPGLITGGCRRGRHGGRRHQQE